MQRIILHIDFDSFFASCEQQFNPLLRGKPIGVTATNGRTCIIAASREAKKQGISSPSRVWEAQQIIPNLILVPANFDSYWHISKKFISIAKEYSPFVEVFSLDEVFIDVTKTVHLFGSVDNIVQEIKQRLAREIGEYITVSVGISHNKMLAKLASGTHKPNGVKYIREEDIENIYAKARLTDICGIGNRIKARLNLIGVNTLLELRGVPLKRLVSEFGHVEGEFLKRVGWGIDESPVIAYTDRTPVKSVGRNYCLPYNTYDETLVLKNMFELCEEIAKKLRLLNKSARTVGAYIKGSKNISVRKTTSFYMDTGKEIFETLMYMINSTRAPALQYLGKNDYVRQIGIWVSNLADISLTPQSLFVEDQKQKILSHTIDMINNKFGHYAVRNGFLLDADKLETKPNGFMSDRYERIKIRTL